METMIIVVEKKAYIRPVAKMSMMDAAEMIVASLPVDPGAIPASPASADAKALGGWVQHHSIWDGIGARGH